MGGTKHNPWPCFQCMHVLHSHEFACAIPSRADGSYAVYGEIVDKGVSGIYSVYMRQNFSTCVWLVKSTLYSHNSRSIFD